MTIYIYALVDPITNLIRYIGQTTQPNIRYSQHITCFSGNSHRVNWLKQYRHSDKKPRMEILEECNSSNWQERENYWIQYGKKQGWPLTNATEGGEGNVGWNPAESTRYLWSTQRKGNKNRVGNKSKSGQKDSEETRLKKSLSNKGNKPSLHTIERAIEVNSEAMKKNTHASKLTKEQVIDIKNLRSKGFSRSYVAKMFNVGVGAIRNIDTGKSWGWL